MTIKIHRILKDDLSESDSINVIASGLSNTSGMTISHFAFSSKQTEATMPYTIDITEDYVPKIQEVDYCVVIRKKIDLTAVVPNEEIITNAGNDVGEYNYKASIPHRPSDLPIGFKEFYKG